MRSGELAAAAGVGLQTVRYYERRGLLAAPRRSPGGHRDYDEGAVRVLRLVRAAQRLGFTLDEITGLLRGRADLQRTVETKLAEVGQRLSELARTRDDLLRVAHAQCTGLTACTSDRCPLDLPARGAGRAVS